MRKLKDNPLIPPLLLLTFFSMLAYLPLIPFLGFYSDDFFFTYIAHFYGPEGIMKSLVIDRPINGSMLILNYFLLGLSDHIFLWHIYAFLTRLIGGYVLFFALLKLWPNRLSTATAIALVFLIYPGFLQQVLPLGFGNWLTTLTLWISSFAFTIWAIKENDKVRFYFFTLIALTLQILTFLNLEFFMGMEVLRLLIISLVLGNKISFKALQKMARYWIPYVVSLVIFVAWRIFIFKSTREVTDINWVAQTYYSDPLWIARIPLEVIHSFIQTVIFAYLIPIIINFIRLPLQDSIIALTLGISSGFLLYLYFKKINKDNDDKNFGKELLLIGLISVLAALLPIIISGRSIRIFNVLDRYTITSVIGVGFIIVGFLIFKIPNSIKRLCLILLVVLSIISHLMNGYWHKMMWDKQRDIWWQLYWRAPNIEKNAMLIFDFPKISENISFKDIINRVKWYQIYWVDYQIWAPGNLFFNYNNSPKNHFNGDFLEDTGIVDKIKNQAVEFVTDRNLTYVKDFRNTVIISTPSDTSCLWVLDKERNELPIHAKELLRSSIAYSDTSNLVKTEIPIKPPKEIFGSEPFHGWCYYFQKASLARQLKNWEKLSQLKEDIIQKNLKPKDPNEWLPFQKDLR